MAEIRDHKICEYTTSNLRDDVVQTKSLVFTLTGGEMRVHDHILLNIHYWSLLEVIKHCQASSIKYSILLTVVAFRLGRRLIVIYLKML